MHSAFASLAGPRRNAAKFLIRSGNSADKCTSETNNAGASTFSIRFSASGVPLAFALPRNLHRLYHDVLRGDILIV